MRDFWLRVFVDNEDNQEFYEEKYHRFQAETIVEAALELPLILKSHLEYGDDVAYIELSDISQEADDFLN